MQSYHLTQWVLFFFIYSFIGWVWECCFVSVRKRRWVNRGFMYEPMLPIYGFGALAVLISTIRVRDSIPLIFLFGMVEQRCWNTLQGRLWRDFSM
ncbi:putative ABC transporter permease [[Ruminococcus] torques]|nr:putative ABC transporter permease [[Ruminococcus] torques]